MAPCCYNEQPSWKQRELCSNLRPSLSELCVFGRGPGFAEVSLHHLLSLRMDPDRAQGECGDTRCSGHCTVGDGLRVNRVSGFSKCAERRGGNSARVGLPGNSTRCTFLSVELFLSHFSSLIFLLLFKLNNKLTLI